MRALEGERRGSADLVKCAGQIERGRRTPSLRFRLKDLPEWQTILIKEVVIPPGQISDRVLDIKGYECRTQQAL